MDESYFKQFLALDNAHTGKQASEALTRFIQSFASSEEREEWAKYYLSSFDGSRTSLPTELYWDVIVPALRSGYMRKEAWSMFWCTKTCEHLSHLRQQLWQQIGI
jgi:hypothetical protein